MNDTASKDKDELLSYQVGRLKALVEETVECCQARTEYLSAKFGLPRAELRCLLLLREERYLTLKEIAGKLDVAKSRVTKIVEGLLGKKLIASVDDPKDARIKLITLTREGRTKCEEANSFTMGLYEKLLREFPPEERKNVIHSLEILRTGMEAIKKQMV